MSAGGLDGASVLVTRPQQQAATLLAAVQDAGGRAVPFPVIDIVPRATTTVVAEYRALPVPDLLVFVSSNAVTHGMHALHKHTARVAAIGPATAEAIERAGFAVDIVPSAGYDSEALLACAELDDMAGKRVCIVRGDKGRELLGSTLLQRGAAVDYHAVYRRQRHLTNPAECAALDTLWRAHGVHFVVAMSIASLDHLLALLPTGCRRRLAEARLVTPSARVIQTAMQRVPEVRPLLAAGPGAGEMVAAMIDTLRPRTDDAHE